MGGNDVYAGALMVGNARLSVGIKSQAEHGFARTGITEQDRELLLRTFGYDSHKPSNLGINKCVEPDMTIVGWSRRRIRSSAANRGRYFQHNGGTILEEVDRLGDAGWPSIALRSRTP